MPYYRQVGEIPHKRHTQFRKPDGGLHTEELMGEEGFSFDSALLYHRSPPTAIVSIDAVDTEDQRVEPNHPLKPRHFKTHGLKGGGNLVSGRHLLMANDDCRISYVWASQTSPLTKNATGDELVYVEEGSGVLESVFGRLPFTAGDYVVVPASTIHRFVLDEEQPVRALVLETRSHIGPPRRYLSRTASSSSTPRTASATLTGPPSRCGLDGENVEVLVRHRGRGHPLHLRQPPVRRRRLGRLPVPVHLHGRTISSRSPGGSTSRRRCTRRSKAPQPGRVQLRAPQVRLPPARRSRRRKPLQRRLRRGDLLRRGQLHEPQGSRHRGRVDLAPSRRAYPRPAAGERRGVRSARKAPRRSR